MSSSGTTASPAFGFLTVVQGGEHGVFGGYLVLNSLGRPLEFHCTAPVKANRAQEILFGPTLEPFLYGEQIARTLIAKSKLKPQLVCTDHHSVMAVRPFLKCPAIWILQDGDAADVMETNHGPPAPWVRRPLVADSVTAAVHTQYASDLEDVERLLDQHQAQLDLAEPFARIREAVEEAQRGRREGRAA